MQRTDPAKARSGLLHALVLISLISADITRLAAETLGTSSTGNREVQVLLLLRAHPGLTPSAVAERTGMRRNALSRTLHALSDDRLVRVRAHPQDGRSKLLYPTRKAQTGIDALETAVGDYLIGQSATLQEIVSLLAARAHGRGPTPSAGPLPGPIGLVEDLTEAGAAYVDEVMTVVTAYGLASGTDRAALLLIGRGGEVRPSTIGTALHLTSGGTTLLLDRLERAGLVARHRPDHAADRRTVLVTCTPHGDEAVSAILQVFEQHTTPLVDALERVQQHVAVMSSSA